MDSLQPPLIVDILCYLILIALIYLVYYSFNLRNFILNQKFEQLLPKENPPTNKKIQPKQSKSTGKLNIFIEPSPIPGKNVQYPSIFSPPELSLSVIVPVHDMQDTIVNVLEKIQIYFSEKKEKSNNNFTYEVIIVDMQSTDSTYSIVYDFALQNPEFRIIKLPYDISLNYSVVVSATRIRGKILFIYLPDENLPMNIFSQLKHKLDTAKEEYNQKEVIVLSCLIDPNQSSIGLNDSDYGITDNFDHSYNQSIYDDHYTTLLSSFTDYVSNKFILWSTNIEPNALNHFRSMLLTREAAQVIFPNIKMSGDWFDMELIVIASKENILIEYADIEPGKCYDSVIDLSSWERIYRLVDVLQILLFYLVGIWKISRRKA